MHHVHTMSNGSDCAAVGAISTWLAGDVRCTTAHRCECARPLQATAHVPTGSGTRRHCRVIDSAVGAQDRQAACQPKQKP